MMEIMSLTVATNVTIPIVIYITFSLIFISIQISITEETVFIINTVGLIGIHMKPNHVRIWHGAVL